MKSFVTPVAMASPPTVAAPGTHFGASTIASAKTILPNAASQQLFLGTDVIIDAGGSRANPAHIRLSSTAGTAGKGDYFGGNFTKRAIMTDADVVEFQFDHAPGGSFRFFVDDQPVQVAGTATFTDFTVRRSKLTFASSAARKIELELTKGAHWEICVGPNYSVWKPEVDPLRVMLIGDSYIDNGGYATTYIDSLGPQLARTFGVPDVFLAGYGGQSYNTVVPVGMSGTGYPISHIPYDITPYKPDWLIVALGINDFTATASALQAAVTAYYTAIFAANPNMIVTVIGPWNAPGQIVPSAIANAIRDGVAALTAYVTTKQIMYIDTFLEDWFQNAGRVGAPSGAGNSNIYIGADNIHQVQAGQDFLRRRIANACMQHLEAILASR
jgi:lysophospholipase L1-like esterase